MKTMTLYILTLVLFGINFSNQNNMDCFDKIFVKKEIQQQILQPTFDTSTIVKTKEMLNEDKFWSIIEESKKHTNPDYLINEVVKNADLYDFEGFWYVALTAFKNKTGKDLYDFVDYDKFTTHEGKYPQFEFTWTEQKPESMKKICPKLFEKLWKL